MDPPSWTEILALIATLQNWAMLRRTVSPKGKHRKRKRYRRGKRTK